MEEAQSRFEQGLSEILNDAERKYIRALIDPFHPDAVGVRVPSLNPVDTYTHTQFESFAINTTQMAPSGKVILIINPTAIRPRPVLMIDDSQGAFLPLDAPGVLSKSVRQYMPGAFDSTVKTLGLWETGPLPAGNAFFSKTKQPVDPIFSQLDQRYAGKIKLVAAGVRIFKTSTAIAESGTIRATYRPRGGVPQTSLDRMVETGPTSRYNVKLFPSQNTVLSERAGFLMQSNYRPHVTDDTDMYYSAT